jgi:hypothetical protein
MPINELVNLRELFHKNNLIELKKLEMLAKSALFSLSNLTRKITVKMIRERYPSIKKIFTGDNQIMAEIYLGNENFSVNGYICDVPKAYSGVYREVQIIPLTS